MIIDLFRLYKRHGYSDRSPLEDFNTETFAGILNLFPDIKKSFTSRLKLPEDIYRVETQYRRALTNDKDCIVDLVLIGAENVCFIENKVHSGEGLMQLQRYCNLLNEHFGALTTHLVYCTKFYDPKKIDVHNFQQIRWYEIARLLKPYAENNPLVKNYLKFLNYYEMSQENTLRTNNILAMEHFKKTFEVLDFHMKLIAPIFSEYFPNGKVTFQRPDENRDRFTCYYGNVIKDENNRWSELMYTIELTNVKLQTQIFLNKNHCELKMVQKLAMERKFNVQEFDEGLLIWLDRKLYDQVNSSDIDGNIKEWFKESFEYFSQFILDTPQISWNIQLKNTNQTAIS